MKRVLAKRTAVALCALLALGSATAATPADSRLAVSSVGDASMAPLMDAWLAALSVGPAKVVKGPRWQHVSDSAAIGALMFETADVAPMTRTPLTIELAPYVHQFAGDMMKSPLMVKVAMKGDRPLYLAVNKRPDTPVAPNVDAFVRFALSTEGQAIVARQPGLQALSTTEAAGEAARLDGWVAALDPKLPSYAAKPVRGEISSVGSDGMKSLMDRWMREFHALQPGVRPGARWEHPGTLNGFHALMAGQTDLAPMGRELWPDEAAAYRTLVQGESPLEIRVAHGGFNTQQRTTAQAVFVHAGNPLQSLTMQQVAAIFGRSPSITRWGQLGLTGEWADRPIVVDMPPRVTPNAMSMQIMALQGGAWNESAREAKVAETAAAIAADPAAIGFGGFEDGGPGLKALAIAADAGSPPVTASGDTVASGRYPLTRYMFIRLRRTPGQPVPAATREFLRYVLSRQGQAAIPYSGYFPLTAREVNEELAKLQ